MNTRALFIFALAFLLSCSSLNSYQSESQQAYRQSSLLPNHQRAQHEATFNNVMIASQGHYTTQAALKVLKQGGNLFDAATAMSFVISVERPHSTGIGGGGFMLTHDAKTKSTKAYDFRETAPQAAVETMYQDAQGNVQKYVSRNGALAIATPGLVKGVLGIHQKYGVLPREKVLQPAIDLAQNGFEIYPALAKAIKARKDVLARFGGKNIFFDKQGQPLLEGDILKQAELAQTLNRIAKQGAQDFYQGKTAKSIVATNKKYGGILTAQDLADYQTKIRQPIWGDYQGYKIASMPPPSSGGVHIIQMLNTLEAFQNKRGHLKQWGPQNAKTIHVVASAMQMAYADRAQYLGDSDFVRVPLKDLSSKQYAQKLADKISLFKAFSAQQIRNPVLLPYESDQTTHFTLMDKHGNVISSTQTINGWFGSGVVASGIVLNNEMDDFASKLGASNLFGAIGGKNNLIEPFKRPLSSMSPTLVFKKNRQQNYEPFLALGTPSGTRIINCVMQTILNRVTFDLPLYESVHLTRYHQQWMPDELRIGPPYFSQETMQQLRDYGYKLNERSLGCKVQAIEKTDAQLIGVSDNRGEGLASGF